MEADRDFPLPEGRFDANGGKSCIFAVSDDIRVAGDPVGTSQRSIMDRLQEIGLPGTVPAEEQVYPRIGMQLQILIIPEVFQFQFCYPHNLLKTENGRTR